jgi:hypothetical protein
MRTIRFIHINVSSIDKNANPLNLGIFMRYHDESNLDFSSNNMS